MGKKEFKKPEGRASTHFFRPSRLAELEKIGVLFEGIFMEEFENNYNPDKNDYKFQITALGDIQDSIDKNGKAIPIKVGDFAIVNSNSSMMHQMGDIQIGRECRVEYLGKKELTSGKLKGKSVHRFEVLVA